MAIVLKYGAPGPILQSGFAAGVGRRKDRQQKDLLDIWQQQTQQAFQAEQSAIDQRNRVGLQEANFEFQAGQNAQQQKAQLLGRAWQAFDADQKRVQGDMLTERRFAQAEFMKLPPIPEHADAESRKMLTKKRNALAELMGPTWDLTKPEVQKAWQEERDAYQSGVQDLQDSFSPADEENKNTIYRDQTGKAFNDAGLPEEGRIPYDRRTGKPIENPQVEAQAKAQVEFQKKQDEIAKKQQEAADKQQEKFAAAEEKWKEKRLARAEKTQLQGADQKTGKLPPLDLDAAEKELAAAGFAKPQQPTPVPTQQEPAQTNPIQQAHEQFQAEQEGQQVEKDLNTLNPMPPVANGVTPELVQKMKDHGAKDPVRAAQAYAALTSGGSLTSADPSQQTHYSPQTREKVLEGVKSGQNALPTPKTQEEAVALGPGAAWVAPDGTIRRNP
jgi:hypothetical protein